MSNFKDLSPILRHALESFEHGIFHHLDGTELGRKFALLHIDHAIELILKERVMRLGHSIYRNDGKTIGVHEAYKILETSNITLPEKPRLEDLHDFRNIVQHKGLAPDEHTTKFYVNEAYRFVKRFLHDELGIKLEDYLSSSYIKVIEGIEPEEEKLTSEVNKQFSEAEIIFATGAYETAVISAFVSLERVIRNKAKESKPVPLIDLLSRLVDEGYLTKVAMKKFLVVYNLRNRVAHTGDRISKEQAWEALNYLKELWKLLSE